MYPLLAHLPLDALQLRFLVLRNFNRRLLAVIDIIDLSRTDAESWVVAGIRRLRGLLFRRSKTLLWRRVLLSTSARDATGRPCDAQWMLANKMPKVRALARGALLLPPSFCLHSLLLRVDTAVAWASKWAGCLFLLL